jgi:hypothetical protein
LNRQTDTAGRGTVESGAAASSTVQPFRSGDTCDAAPAFNEAWHAQALAVADSLIRAKRVTPAEWSTALGDALTATQAQQDDEAAYYAAVLQALETLTNKLDGMNNATLETRTEAWRAAYLSTPHGEPVQLTQGDHND